MFMFRNRRHALVKKLWKLRKCSQNSPDEQSANGRGAPRGQNGGPEEDTPTSRRRETAAQSMLKRLKESQLDDLIRAVESKGACDPRGGPCCLVPRGDVRNVGARPLPPHVLLAQLFRWPDLQHSFELKRLPICRHRGSLSLTGNFNDCDESSELYECCNPYHWSRLLKPAGSSPLPSGLLDRLRQSGDCHPDRGLHHRSDGLILRRSIEDDALSVTSDALSDVISDDVVSYSTNGTQQNGSSIDDVTGRRTWCKLAYWEECTRVGRQFPVTSSTVDVFSALPKGNGLCLASLFDQNKKPTESTSRTREKIGQGILLSHDGCDSDEPGSGGVWLYNRTDFPIFVNSSTLSPPPASTATTTTGLTSSQSMPSNVYKVPPSYSIQIFDYEKSRLYERLRESRPASGPYDPYSIRISFAKGWGSNYSRQCVTTCPCWLEVLLVVPSPPPHR